MESVKVKRSELLKIIRKNRETHYQKFEKALEDYKVVVIKTLEEKIEQAQRGIEIDEYVSLVRPKNQTKCYDRVIRMLELCVDKTVELDHQEAENYIFDRWDWTNQFETLSSGYAATASFYVGK